MVPKKVLHLIDTGGPGGAETIFLELVSRIGLPRWESVPVVPVDDWLARALRERGHDPIILFSKRPFDFQYLARLRSLVASHGICLIQAHLLSTSVYGTLAAWGRGIPLIATFHGVPDVPEDESLRWFKLRLISRSGNRAVFVSNSLRERLHFGNGSSGPPTEVIPNGIDCDLFQVRRSPALRAELGLNEEALILGAVGNVRGPKRYGVLLQAFSQVRAVFPAAQLVIAGQAQGALFRTLEEARSSLGLEDSVHFLGFREDIPELMQGFDIFVLSSSDEGFSLSTVQAMATGLPIVATKCGGPEEILRDGVDGRLVEVNDSGSLARGIMEVASLPDRGAEYGKAARERAVSRFSVEAMVDRYEAAYDRSLQGV